MRQWKIKKKTELSAGLQRKLQPNRENLGHGLFGFFVGHFLFYFLVLFLSLVSVNLPPGFVHRLLRMHLILFQEISLTYYKQETPENKARTNIKKFLLHVVSANGKSETFLKVHLSENKFLYLTEALHVRRLCLKLSAKSYFD